MTVTPANSVTGSINATISPPVASPLSQYQNVSGPLSGATPQTPGKIDKLATDFEAVFLTQMLKPMFAGESMEGYFGSGAAGDIYKGFMLDELGKVMAKAGGIGIAPQVKQQLLTYQEIGS